MIGVALFVTVVGALLAAFVERTIGLIVAALGILLLLLAILPAASTA